MMKILLSEWIEQSLNQTVSWQGNFQRLLLLKQPRYLQPWRHGGFRQLMIVNKSEAFGILCFDQVNEAPVRV
ncbi:hypothetical protein Hdeb2414_s0011g00359951 [Helianthus debilis subsp. tardiflorus]